MTIISQLDIISYYLSIFNIKKSINIQKMSNFALRKVRIILLITI
jgi:hypothetical protein